MKTVYMFAAALAMSAHAVFLLGFNQAGAKRVPLLKEKVVTLSPFFVPLAEEPLVVEKKQDAEQHARKGSTDVGPPASPEPRQAAVDRGMVMTTPPPLDPRVTDPNKITGGIIGLPDGLDNGKTLKDVKIYSSIELDRSPRARLQPAPIYPVLAKSSGMTGEVLVTFTVDENGSVLSPRVLQSTDRMFDEPTLASVSKWRFEPGKKDGRPVRFKMAVPVTFRLNE